MATDSDSILLQRFIRTLEESGRKLIFQTFDDEPDLLIFDEKFGIAAVDFAWLRSDETVRSETAIKQKVREITGRYPALKQFMVVPIVIPRLSEKMVDLALKTIEKIESDTGVDKLELQNLWKEIGPKSCISFEARVRNYNFESTQVHHRIKLDNIQEQVAVEFSDQVIWLSGPPGSGKTLVLVARARYLATQNPSWRIQILCYNHVLANYIRSLVAGYPNVHVDTVKSYVGSNWGIVTRVKTNDALLIDEWQDFTSEYSQAALRTLKPNRGGLVVAGDKCQAIYLVDPDDSWLRHKEVRHVELKTPYRSSREILQAVSVLDPESEIANVMEAPSVDDIEIVRADDMNSVAQAVVADVRRLIQGGVEPGKIGVLTLYKAAMWHTLAPAFNKSEIDFRFLRRLRDETWNDVDVTQNVVKISTIAASKGLEFEYVLLSGLDSLDDPEEFGISSEERDERIKFNRSIFVGMTRASDYLYIYYHKDNYVTRRLTKAMENLQFKFWQWPDDYTALAEDAHG